MAKYSIEVTEDQLKVLSKACEFYARIAMGQFNEIIWNFLVPNVKAKDFCERRDIAQHFLLKAREQIYPELHGIGHSYGIGKFKDADMAFDIYQVTRIHLGDARVPFSFHELPVCKKIEEEAK